MFEEKTWDVIRDEMLDNVRDDVDKREGSVAYDLLAATAIEGELLYTELDALYMYGFIDTSQGQWVDLRAGELGLTRKPAEVATGQVTFTYSQDITIPAGTRLTTGGDEPIYFVTTEPAELVNGTATVAAEAEEGGAAGNVAAGRIVALADDEDYADVVSVTNSAPFSGGVDEETDEELIERYKERVSKPATSGNVYQYEQWAKEITGIAQVRVYPVWNGPGTVKVVLVSSEGRAPSADKVQEVADYIESLRPIGADVTYIGCAERPIDVTATLTLQAGTDVSAVQQAYIDALTAMFKDAAFTDSMVRYSRLADLILNQNGVIDYADLTINGGTSNIVLGDDEVAVVGTVTFYVAS
jgi:uncharacterized phage protein gp47/JayE